MAGHVSRSDPARRPPSHPWDDIEQAAREQRQPRHGDKPQRCSQPARRGTDHNRCRLAYRHAAEPLLTADLAHPANTRNAPEREHRSSAPERRGRRVVGQSTERRLCARPTRHRRRQIDRSVARGRSWLGGGRRHAPRDIGQVRREVRDRPILEHPARRSSCGQNAGTGPRPAVGSGPSFGARLPDAKNGRRPVRVRTLR